jgi:hypothetical protein
MKGRIGEINRVNFFTAAASEPPPLQGRNTSLAVQRFRNAPFHGLLFGVNELLLGGKTGFWPKRSVFSRILCNVLLHAGVVARTIFQGDWGRASLSLLAHLFDKLW